MLVLDRKAQEGLWIGEGIFVRVLGIRRGRVKLAINAASDLRIVREELRPGRDGEPWTEANHRDGVDDESIGRAEPRDTARTTEDHYRALLEAIPDLVFHLDGEGTFLDFVAAKGQQLAIPPAEFLGRTVSEVLPVDVARRAMDHIKRALRTGDTQVFEYELPVLLPVGNPRDYEARIAVSGKNEVLAIARDVTGHRRAQEALRESEERFRRLSQATLEGIVIDDSAVVMDANPQVAAMVGCGLPEFIGQDPLSFVSPESRDAVRQHVTSAREGFCEALGLRKDGTTFPMEVRGKVAFYEGREVRVSVVRDLTERRQAEEALRESEERLRTLVTNAPVILFAIDGEGVFTVAEGRGMTPVGLRPGEHVGRSVFDVYRNLPGVIDAARRALAGEAFSETVETENRVFEAHVTPLRGGDGAITGAVAVATDVTERKRAEAALRASEQRLRTVVENSPVGLFAIDREGVITLSEGKVQEAMRLTAGEHVGLSMFEVYRDFPGIVEGTRRVLAGEAMTDKIRVGRTVLEVRATPIKDQDGKVTGAIGVATDITEHYRAENALRESEERLRTVVANAPVLLFAIDREGVFTVEAGKGLSRLGLRPDENVGRSVLDVYGDVPEVAEAAHRALAGESFTTTVELAGLAFEAHYAPLRDRRGRLSGGIGVATDVTERKRAEDALRASEEMWRSLVQNSPDVIMNVARDGTILLINRTLPGFPPPEHIVGTSVYEFIPPQDHDTMRRSLERAFQTGEPDGFETAGGGPHRTTSYYTTRVAPVRHDGEVASVNLIATDVTELKRAEEALQRAREELEARVERQMERGRAYDLTFRELTVLHLVAAGRADKEIAAELGISPRTVNKHLENILHKMGCGSRTEAGVRAVREDLLGPAD